VIQRLAVTVALVALAACGGAQGDRPETAADGHLVSEALPIPEGDAGEATSTEPSASTEEATEEPGPQCELEVDDPSAARQLAGFQRWLMDQTVGRRLTIEGLVPMCGDLEGSLVVDVDLSGPAGGLDSLSRALPLYYPGSTWTVGEYERLGGRDVQLRVTVEVRVPTGSEPRPRCAWDPATPCPPGVTP
jgi:hypothetical protein